MMNNLILDYQNYSISFPCLQNIIFISFSATPLFIFLSVILKFYDNKQ